MILIFDTYYFDDKAKTVCLSFKEWTAIDDFEVHSEVLECPDEYISGEFYRRELPCILSLLGKIDLANVEVIVVDGFVYLDDHDSLGLGGHLFYALGEKIPVIGVAKTNYASIEHNKRALVRGESKKPLYITSIGLDVDIAVGKIDSMVGKYRIPTLLKKLDTLTKE